MRRLPAALACAALALLSLGATSPPSPLPTATPIETPTPSPLPPPPGALRVRKTDPSGNLVTTPGARFNIHRGSPGGQVVATLTTDGTGTATAARLQPDTYCVEETAAPPGYQTAPTYVSGQNGCTYVPSAGIGSVSVADPLAATPTPTPTAAPTPLTTGELRVVKTDPSGQTVMAAGFTFNIHAGSASGPVVSTITTDGSGTAVVGSLNPFTYCVEETAAAAGYQVAPTYSPDACVAVASDPTQGRSPTTVTVADPPSSTPSPSPSAGAAAQPPSPPSRARSAGSMTPPPAARGTPLAALSVGLVGFGLVLLVAGAALIVAARRRKRRPPEPPPDVWYDSTIT